MTVDIETASFGKATLTDTPKYQTEWGRKEFGAYPGFSGEEERKAHEALRTLWNQLATAIAENKGDDDIRKLFAPYVSDSDIQMIKSIMEPEAPYNPRMLNVEKWEGEQSFPWTTDSIALNVNVKRDHSLFKGGKDRYESTENTSAELWKNPETGEYLFGRLLKDNLFKAKP